MTAMVRTLAALLLAAGLAAPAHESLDSLAQRAVSSNPAETAAALTRLREAGPKGLEVFLRVHGAALAEGPSEPLAKALDALCQQHDCAASRLFWYTDFERARAAAGASGKPILSLRLLGNLDEELSCANSRLFRTLLYPDPEVSAYLREHFVLHWKSVRPVPVVTIDFGEGRVLRRTVTGNSIHYVLDPEGRAVDALPGLYAPAAFLQALEPAVAAARRSAGLPAEERADFLRTYHLGRLAAAEVPAGPVLNPSTVELIRSKYPSAIQASEVAPTKMAMERPLLRMLRNLEDSLAQDTALNETVLHRQIHEWLAGEEANTEVEALNERVYAELFRTPSADPWLGLASGETYDALANQ